MRVLLGGNAQVARTTIYEVLNSCASGCEVVGSCALDRLADQVAQHRPDVLIVDFSADADAALQAIEEAQEAFPVRVLAVGPSSDAKLILRTLNHGVDKYVDSAALDPELPVAIRRVDVQPRVRSPRGRVISVVGCGGGCGATTLVANVGATLAGKGKPCYLVDLDLETGDLASILGVQWTHSIAEFCQNLNRMDAALLEKCLTTYGANLTVMPAPADYHRIAAVTPRGVRKAINMVRGLGSYVVVDVPSTFRPEQAQALFAADVIVVVLRAEFASVRQASRVLAYLADLSIPRERIRLVVNRRIFRQGLREADIESSLEMPIHMTIPEHSRHMTAAVNRGIPLVVDRPRSPVSHRLCELASSVNGAPHTDVRTRETH
jgi:pilus assembly protein CpaE